MKKMLKGNKGFSLIELLIVVAILAVLAAISISLFGNVLNNSKEDTNRAFAKTIETALQSYIVESGDNTLTNMAHGGEQDLITALAGTTTIGTKSYGPYLNSATNPLQNSWHLQITLNSTEETVTVATDKLPWAFN